MDSRKVVLRQTLAVAAGVLAYEIVRQRLM